MRVEHLLHASYLMHLSSQPLLDATTVACKEACSKDQRLIVRQSWFCRGLFICYLKACKYPYPYYHCHIVVINNNDDMQANVSEQCMYEILVKTLYVFIAIA